MIQSVMLCGIGLLGGCLLMLPFFPLIHERAVRLTKQQLADTTPMTVNEIQADKDHLRAEFAMSVRRLELRMEEMRAKAIARSSDQQQTENRRLKIELDKKTALILALRAREEVRKGTVRRIVKIVLYLFVRSKRWRRPQLFKFEHKPTWEFEQQEDQNELAATAAAIAALNLKRRQAVANRH